MKLSTYTIVQLLLVSLVILTITARFTSPQIPFTFGIELGSKYSTSDNSRSDIMITPPDPIQPFGAYMITVVNNRVDVVYGYAIHQEYNRCSDAAELMLHPSTSVPVGKSVGSVSSVSFSATIQQHPVQYTCTSLEDGTYRGVYAVKQNQ